MRKTLKHLTVTVSFKIEVDINELLEGVKVNTTIEEIRKNVGGYLRQNIAYNKLTPGEELCIPDNGDIAGNLHEWDLLSYED
jgi:hypothetical protein